MAISKNNLKAVLKDTADAIRSKTGSSSNIIPRNFADTISSIQIGEDVTPYYSNTVVNAVVPDGITTNMRTYMFNRNTSLVSVDFNNATIIPASCCNDCSNLKNITFSTNTTRIENSAFQNCKQIDNLSLPHTITYVGNSAFKSVGNSYSAGTHTFEFIDDVGVETHIENYAFQQSHLSKIVGVVNNCGDSAFLQCSSLTYVDVKFDNCEIGTQAFNGCTNIQYFNIDSSSVITALGSSAFLILASNTYTTAIINPFDFRNSTFPSVEADVWNGNKYDGIIYFPATLASIFGNFLNNTTGNWTLYFNSIPSVSSSSYLRYDVSGTFSVKYIFLYTLLETAKVATNWSNHTSQMLGYGVFQNGDTLPTTQGTLTLTWYDDFNLTNQVSVASSDGEYYCTFA